MRERKALPRSEGYDATGTISDAYDSKPAMTGTALREPTAKERTGQLRLAQDQIPFSRESPNESAGRACLDKAETKAEGVFVAMTGIFTGSQSG